MKSKKIFAAVLSLVLIVAMTIPGTLAPSNGQDSAEGEFTVADGSMSSAPDAEPTVEPEAGSSLFERLMACTTLEELFALIDETPEEQLMQLSESQVAEVEAKIAALEPEPLPSVEIEESSDEPVPSEIIYPTVNFDDVAPLGDPVVGGEG